MKPLDELKAFCEGYLQGALACNANVKDWDDWVLWGGYDIQFSGSYHDDLAPNKTSLACDAYQAGWVTLPEKPVHRFAIIEEGEEA